MVAENPYPTVSIPIVEPGGTPTASFFNLLMQLWTRTGGQQGNLLGVQLTNGQVLPLDVLASEIVNELITNPATLAKLVALIVPTGTLWPWPPGGAAPTGFILADGSAVSRTTYAALFDKIGTTYGAGDGFATFNLPNGAQSIPFTPGLSVLPLLGAMPWIIKT